jgi:hypothetical protein
MIIDDKNIKHKNMNLGIWMIMFHPSEEGWFCPKPCRWGRRQLSTNRRDSQGLRPRQHRQGIADRVLPVTIRSKAGMA